MFPAVATLTARALLTLGITRQAPIWSALPRALAFSPPPGAGIRLPAVQPLLPAEQTLAEMPSAEELEREHGIRVISREHGISPEIRLVNVGAPARLCALQGEGLALLAGRQVSQYL